MYLKVIALLLTLSLYYTNAAVFLWSNRKLNVRPLQEFTDHDFEVLLEKLNNPIVYSFRASSLNPEIKSVIKGYHTAYSVNGHVNLENVTELEGDDSDKAILEEKMSEIEEPIPVLFIVVIPKDSYRSKREVAAAKKSAKETPDGEVFYLGKSKNNDFYGLLYSTKNLLLTMNGSNITLGNTSSDMITVDKGVRDDTLRFKLNINIPLEGGKVTLIFIFAWLKTITYWQLESVVVKDMRSNLNVNLVSVNDLLIPPGFSYHCPGKTMFVNNTEAVSLIIDDMQIEMDSKDKKFSDAWDCITFTTAPIWSGLFVASILVLGAFIGFAAIGDIKTMDRFDNHKTKQLHITTFE